MIKSKKSENLKYTKIHRKSDQTIGQEWLSESMKSKIKDIEAHIATVKPTV